MLQQIALGGAMIVLPLFLQMTLEYNAMQAGLSLAPLSLTMFAIALLAGRRPGPAAGRIIRAGFALATIGMAADHPARARGSTRLVSRDPAGDRRLRVWACWSRSSTTTPSPRSPRNGSAKRPG